MAFAYQLPRLDVRGDSAQLARVSVAGIMLRTLFAAGAAALVMIAAAGTAQAAMMRATISNGVFDDTGTFAGWFVFDDASAVAPPTAWDLVTTGGSNLGGDTYKSGGPGQTAGNISLLGVVPTFVFTHDSGSGPDFLQVDLAGLSSGVGSEYHQPCFACSIDALRSGTFDYQVTAVVPEPGTWTLTILGLGLAGAALRRRRTLLGFCAPM